MKIYFFRDSQRSIESLRYLIEDNTSLILNQLAVIKHRLAKLEQRGRIMSQALDALALEVERNVTVTASAIALIHGIAAQLADLKDNPEEIMALATKLDASADALAAVIEANTEVVPPVVEEPIVEEPVIEEPIVDPIIDEEV